MKARIFNGSLMPCINESWAARVLGMQKTSNGGIDLVNDKKGVEIKFHLVGEKSGAQLYSRIWTILDYQMAYGTAQLPAFWGLGHYELDRPVSKIKTKSPGDLERFVLSRELWIVNWSWMEQFPPHETRGKTKKSSWNNVLRYAKFRCLPKNTRNYEVHGGLVHLTEGVNPELFSFLEKN
jgi:hypothetical protein